MSAPPTREEDENRYPLFRFVGINHDCSLRCNKLRELPQHAESLFGVSIRNDILKEFLDATGINFNNVWAVFGAPVNITNFMVGDSGMWVCDLDCAKKAKKFDIWLHDATLEGHRRLQDLWTIPE